MSQKKSEPTPVKTPDGVEPIQTPAPAAENPSADQETASAGETLARSTEDIEVLQEKAAKADTHWDLYLRARAELDNYRRRATRERQEAVRYANQGLMEKILPVLDSLDKATEASQSGDHSALDALREGVSMVQGQLKSILVDAGVEEIDAAGQPFDPNLHEAVAHHESAEVADGHVLQQIRKGYKLHDRLIRAATVVVAKAPAA